MGFKIVFDKNTIDHLGIKLYSSFPPVIAELISNSYDADAEKVSINIDYQKKEVSVIDDGLGMTHDELNENFLVIGRNRRKSDKTGVSQNKQRKVTGKKGLGKLAVFGIAKTIEVYSVKNNISNAFSINYDDLKESTGDYKPKIIFENESTENSDGTKVIIKEIKQKKIMDINQLAISLSRRFSFYDADFEVNIVDKNKAEQKQITKSIFFSEMKSEFEWKFPDDFAQEIATTDHFKRLQDKGVTGQIFTNQTPLKKKDSGFLLYVRSKLASENIFFDDRSNDVFNSYVTGFFNIDFIDESNENDYISTARQSILWEENVDVEQLKKDLNKLVVKINGDWKTKRKDKKEEKLVIKEEELEGLSGEEKAKLKKVKRALLTNSSGIDDIDSIKNVLDNLISMFKFESFREYVEKLENEELTVENINKIATDWEFIEAKELAKIAVGRISAIQKFKKFINENASESKLMQPFLEQFPWLLDPRITTFKREATFSLILKENFPEKDLNESNKRLDFLCNLVNGELIIIELKRPNIKISMKEITQARKYERFLKKNHKLAIEKGVKTFLISDRYDLTEEAQDIYESIEKDNKLFIKSYTDLLNEAIHYNKEFIEKFDELKGRAAN